MHRLVVSAAFSTLAIGSLGPALARGAEGGQIAFGTPLGASNGLALMDADKMVTEALKYPLKTTTFTWASGGMASVSMEPVATHICLLTEVSGNFAGGGERVALDIDKKAPGGPRWVIKGVSSQPALRASATCARKDQFTPGMYSANNVRVATLPLFLDTTCGPTKHNAFKSQDTAGFVREMVGKFRGGGEGLLIAPATMGNTGLHIAACSGYVGGSPLLIAFGGTGPDGKKGFGGTFKYYGRYGATTQMADATWSFVTFKLPNGLFGSSGETFITEGADQPLIPADKALCGIVGVSGKLQGYGERVRVYQSGGSWRADIKTSGPGSQVAGAIRCIARDQR